MKIYKHRLHFHYYEYYGEYNVYMAEKMDEDKFIEFFNREYAGNFLDDVADTLDAGGGTSPFFEIREFELAGESDGHKIYHEKDLIGPKDDWTFSVTEINVIEGE